MIYTAVPGRAIPLGYVGENRIEAVVFDRSSWVEEYGPGTIELVHRRRQDSAPLPVLVDVSGGVVTWTVSDADTAYRGAGECQLTYFGPDGKIKKSEIWQTLTQRSLTSSEEVPEPYEGWVDQVLEAGAASVEAREICVQCAASAQTDADRAEQAAAQSGYMYFYIDDNGDLIYERTPNVTQVDFYLDDGDLYLEAIG
jgi:hypothetical protein